jgi:sugar phosphate isomerase/epimerase
MTETKADLILGINTCFAVKRWPDPADWIEIVTTLGLDSVQLSLDLLPLAFDRRPALAYVRRAAKLADAAGVRIHSLFTGLAAYSSGLLLSDDTEDRLAAFRWYQDIIEITAEAGARGVGGHIGALSVRAASSQAMTQRLIDEELSMMRDLADTAQRAGLDHLQFENLAVSREYGHTIAEAHALEDALVDTAVPWRLCLDLGHPAAIRTDQLSAEPQNWLAQPWRNTPVVQLQQSPRGADHHGPFTDQANAEGTVTAAAVVETIRANWSGEVFLFFEIIHPHEYDDQKTLQELQASVEHWCQAMQES